VLPGGLSGVWAVDFKIDTLSSELLKLKVNLPGTIFIADESRMLLASSSENTTITGGQSVANSDDSYTTDANTFIQNTFDYPSWSNVDPTIIYGHSIVSTMKSTVDIRSIFVDVVSLSRVPIFTLFEHALNITFTAIVFLCLGLALVHSRTLHRTERTILFHDVARMHTRRAPWKTKAMRWRGQQWRIKRKMSR